MGRSVLLKFSLSLMKNFQEFYKYINFRLMLKSAFSLMKQQNFQELGNIFHRTRLILLFKGL